MKKNNTLKNILIVIIGVGISRGTAFFNSIIIARLLGPAAFGKFALFQISMILTWQFSQAFDTTYVRYAKASNSEEDAISFLRTTFLLKTIYILILLLLSFPLSKILSFYVFKKPELFIELLTGILSGSFLGFYMTCASVFQAKEKFITFSAVNSIFPLLVFIFLSIIYLTSKSFQLNVVILIYSTITLMLAIFGFVYLFTKTGNPLKIKSDYFDKSFHLSKWIFGVTIVFFVFQRIDTLFLTRMVSVENIGTYFAATQIVMFVSLLSSPLGNVFLPMASAAIKDLQTLKDYIKNALKAVATVNIFILLLMVFAPPIIKACLGHKYIAAIPILRILLIGWLFWIAYQPLSFLFYAMEDSRTRFFLELSKLLVGIIFLYILVPKHGLTGAAFSISGALILNSIFSTIVLSKKLSKTYSKLQIA